MESFAKNDIMCAFMETEDIIIKRAQAGDVEAFEQLISSYHDRVYNTLLHLTGNHTDANDLYQETFLNAFKAINKYKSKSALFTWLYRIAHNVFINYCKKAHKKYEMLESDSEQIPQDGYFGVIDAIAKEDHPAIKLEQAMFEQKIRNTVLLLPEEYQEPVVLYDVEAYSYEEIAEILSVPIGTIRSRINRGRKLLREFLLKEGYFVS